MTCSWTQEYGEVLRDMTCFGAPPRSLHRRVRCTAAFAAPPRSLRRHARCAAAPATPRAVSSHSRRNATARAR